MSRLGFCVVKSVNEPLARTRDDQDSRVYIPGRRNASILAPGASEGSQVGTLAATRQQSLHDGEWMAWSSGAHLLLSHKHMRVSTVRKGQTGCLFNKGQPPLQEEATESNRIWREKNSKTSLAL